MQGELDILHIIWESGIVVKLVLIVLVFSSILSFSIAWKKFNDLKRCAGENDAFLKVFHESNDFNHIHENTMNLNNSTFKIMFECGREQILKIGEKHPEKSLPEVLVPHTRDYGFSIFQRSLDQGMNIANERINAYLTTLASIGSIAPFIGLFGTVWGIIDSFNGLASGGASLEAVAPGIAEALVATAVGLFAAIPAVWFFNRYSSSVSTINSEMDNFSKEFINQIERGLI